MKIEFKDYYGQYVDVNNETASGNIRLRVRTMENMNDVAMTKRDDCEVETDISLTSQQVEFLISSLQMMISEIEE